MRTRREYALLLRKMGRKAEAMKIEAEIRSFR
jgi:hypothetical protein